MGWKRAKTLLIKGASFTAFVFVLCFSSATAISATDFSPPEVISATLDKSVVDVSGGEATLRLTARVVDESEIDRFFFTIRHLATGVDFFINSSGDPSACELPATEASCELEFTLDRDTLAGEWELSFAWAQDVHGNTWSKNNNGSSRFDCRCKFNRSERQEIPQTLALIFCSGAIAVPPTFTKYRLSERVCNFRSFNGFLELPMKGAASSKW